eukprot:210049-Amorphochlora_amoeboformis.AAC.1
MYILDWEGPDNHYEETTYLIASLHLSSFTKYHLPLTPDSFGGGMDGGMDPDNPEKAIFAIKEAYTAKGTIEHYTPTLDNPI